MREESQGLKDVSQFATLRREREITGGVEKDFFSESDFTGSGLLQAGDAIEERGLSGAGRGEENDKAGRERYVDVQHKGLRCVRTKLLADFNDQHSEAYFTGQGDQTRRVTPWAIESNTHETRSSNRAGPSAPAEAR